MITNPDYSTSDQKVELIEQRELVPESIVNNINFL